MAFGVYDAPHDMALPAVFLIDGEAGHIHHKQVGDSIADRAGASALLREARKLSAAN